jgi:hypothetical protein
MRIRNASMTRRDMRLRGQGAHLHNPKGSINAHQS